MTARQSRRPSLRKYLVYALLLPSAYLLHVCVMPYLSFGGVTPNLLFAVIAVVTVAVGRLQAFWAGLIYGLLLQILLPSVSYVSLAVYPVSSLFVSFIFADKSLRTLQMDRALKKEKRAVPAWLRTVLCAMANVLVYETVNVAYIYLGGTALTLLHFRRAARDVLLTGLLTLLIAFPLRRLLLGPRPRSPSLRNDPIVFQRK